MTRKEKLIRTFLRKVKDTSCVRIRQSTSSHSTDVSITERHCCCCCYRRVIRVSKRPVEFCLAGDRPTTRRKNLAAMSRRRDQHHPTSVLRQSSALHRASINDRVIGGKCVRLQLSRHPKPRRRTLPLIPVVFKRFNRFETLRYKLPHAEFTHRKLTYNVQVVRTSHVGSSYQVIAAHHLLNLPNLLRLFLLMLVKMHSTNLALYTCQLDI